MLGKSIILALTLCAFTVAYWRYQQAATNAPPLSPVNITHIAPSFPPEMPTPPIQLTPEEYANGGKRYAEVHQRISPRLNAELAKLSLSLGSPVFIQIFKQTHELELWIQQQDGASYTLFKTYHIAGMSGELGPKLAEGDMQAPEGFYTISPTQLNPQSRFHLSFNIGYPNDFDRAHGRHGTNIMVHGNRISIGCFAMTDYYIEEIYTLCAAALENGQPAIPLHSYPFRLTDENLNAAADHPWYEFWKTLQPAYLHFNTHHKPPHITIKSGEYLVESW